MNRALWLVALCAGVSFPVAAVAQQPSPRAVPPSPSPAMRALMDRIHADAKTAAYAAMTPAHATSTAAIAAQVAAGSLDGRGAAEKIDGFLTGDEAKAVMAAAGKTRYEMFAAMQAAGGGGPMMGHGFAVPPGGMPMSRPSGPPMGGDHSGPPMGGPGGMHGDWHGHRQRHHGHHGRLSAGRYLLMISLTPEQMHALMARPRPSATP
jgi:hypothetical protein